jgi:hypothetical protein
MKEDSAVIENNKYGFDSILDWIPACAGMTMESRESSSK